MSIKVIGAVSGTEANIDTNRNFITVPGVPAGNHFAVAGGPTGIIAAALAADVSLVAGFMSLTPAVPIARLTRFQVSFAVATVGASAGVAGSFGLYKTSVAALTGGTARTPINKDSAGAATNMSWQDKASALSETGVTFSGILGRFRQTLGVTTGNFWSLWDFVPTGSPIILRAGEGICLRTIVALAATETEVIDWMAEYSEVSATA